MYKPVVSILNTFVKTFRLLHIEGLENFPKGSPVVVACTHRGWVDVVMLSVALRDTELHFMAKKELFGNRFLESLIRSLNAFPVNRENPGPSSLKIPIKLLKDEFSIGIFPSGKRTTEEVPLKRGAATIAVKAGVPLVPVYYSGPRNFKDLFRGEKGLIRIGKPVQLDETLFDKKSIIDETMNQMEKELKNISNP